MKEKGMKIFGLILVVIFVVLAAIQGLTNTYDYNAESKANIATSTYYDYKWYSLKTNRNKISTSKVSTKTSSVSKKKIAKFTNKTKTKQSYEYSYSKTLEGSVSLGAKVPLKAIELEAGCSVSYSTTTTISATVTVPKKKSYTVYKQNNKDVTKYKSTIQMQIYYPKKGWKNASTPVTSNSTVYEYYPEIIISNK